jgi:peptidoglycan/LPS O-acetylase OafA/YrhL
VFFLLPRFPFFYTTIGFTNGPPAFLPGRFLGYFFFLPNTTDLKFGKLTYISQTWSLGVEEFFYLFFPLLLYFLPWKRIRNTLVILVLFFIILSAGIAILGEELVYPSWLQYLKSYYFDRYLIYSFALGALAAWFYGQQYSPNRIATFLQKKEVAWIMMLVLLLTILTGTTFWLLTQQVYSIFFAAALYSFTASGIQFKLLNNPVMVYLGKIAYGIYMFHPIVITLCIYFFRNMGRNSNSQLILISLASVLVTILVAAISYASFEKIFLRIAHPEVSIKPERNKREEITG